MERMREIYVRSADPYERGIQHGSQVREEILTISKNYEKTFKEKGYTWEEVLGMAMGYVPFLEEKMPELFAELKGIADGAKVDLALVLVLNTRYELLKFKKEENYFDSNECTCFCVTPEATRERETIGGQNWDNSEYIGENLYILHIDEENGTKIMGITEPGQLIRSGMNNHGISVNCSTLLTKKDYRGISVPTNFMRRRLLQCKNLEEARKLILDFKPCVSLNYVVTSAEGDAFIYETTPKEHYEVELHKGLATQGNDIKMNPEIERFTPADKDHTVHFRGQRLEYLLKKKRGDITPEYIMECLKDHDGYPASVCDHAADEGLKTIASMLYCVSRGYALICRGCPCEGHYEKYEI